MYPKDIAPGIVVVYTAGFGSAYALCSCGWSGPRRLLTAAACLDAWAHAAENRCDVSDPMVISSIQL
jgi:hypothetical protein